MLILIIGIYKKNSLSEKKVILFRQFDCLEFGPKQWVFWEEYSN